MRNTDLNNPNASPPQPPAQAPAETWPTGAPDTPGPNADAKAPANPIKRRHGRKSPSPAADAEAVHRIVRDLRPRARVLALVSGKGGVGKTNLAVNIAIGLATLGKRVLLVDCDIGLANTDLVIGQRPRGDLGHVLAGRLPLSAIVQEGPAGIHWVPGASYMPAIGNVGEHQRRALLDALTALESQHDFVILDAPAGIGSGVLALARQADELLLVTTPEPPAVMDAYVTLKAVAATGADAIGRVRLIVNMIASRRDFERVHKRLDEVAHRFLGIRVGLLGYVFCDGHVGRAVLKQEPLVLAFPHSQAAWCVKRLAAAILDEAELSGQGRPGFFERVANLFRPGADNSGRGQAVLSHPAGPRPESE